MKGFHVCKPGNAPTVGQVKSLLVVGDRIKSKALDQGGQNYTITAAVQRESYKDSYGNVGYDIEIEPANGSQGTQQSTQGGTSNATTMSREDYWRNKDQRDIDAIPRMTRSHSQEMAIRWITLLTTLGVMKPEEVSTPKKLRDTIDFFQRDVGRTASATTATKPESDPAEGDVF